MSRDILIQEPVDRNGHRSISLLHAEIVHSARGEIRLSFEVVSRTSFRSGDPIISAAQFHAWSCQSGLMVSRWNVRCPSCSRTDIYEVRTPHDIRSIHAIYLIAFLLASSTNRVSPLRFEIRDTTRRSDNEKFLRSITRAISTRASSKLDVAAPRQFASNSLISSNTNSMIQGTDRSSAARILSRTAPIDRSFVIPPDRARQVDTGRDVRHKFGRLLFLPSSHALIRISVRFPSGLRGNWKRSFLPHSCPARQVDSGYLFAEGANRLIIR